MNEQLEKFLKEINRGRLYKAQKVIAEALEISEVAVSKWCSGKNIPSENNIEKIAKKFNKSKEEIENIFLSNFDNKNNHENKNKNGKNIKDEEIKLLKEKIKFLEEQLIFYKKILTKEKKSNIISLSQTSK